MAKSEKICIVCGKKFEGTAKAEVCGATCRKRLSRLKSEGKQPPYALIGSKKYVTMKTTLKKIAPKIEEKEALIEPDKEKKEMVSKPKKTVDYSNRPDPKKDRSGFAKWMRDNVAW